MNKIGGKIIPKKYGKERYICTVTKYLNFAIYIFRHELSWRKSEMELCFSSCYTAESMEPIQSRVQGNVHLKKGKTVMVNHRNGNYSVDKAHNGLNSKTYYYITPKEMFESD